MKKIEKGANMNEVTRRCNEIIAKADNRNLVQARLDACDSDIDYLLKSTELTRTTIEASVQVFLQCRNACATYLGLEVRELPDFSHIPEVVESILTGRVAEMSSQR